MAILTFLSKALSKNKTSLGIKCINLTAYFSFNFKLISKALNIVATKINVKEMDEIRIVYFI